MTRDDLTLVDLQNIQASLSMAQVTGVNAAMALVVLHNKISAIIQAETDGSRNSTDSDKSGADKPSPADNQ